MTGLKADVRVFEDGPALMKAAADVLAEAARTSARERGTFRIALSGGATVKPLFYLLAGDDYRALPWDKSEVLWGDDRYVPWDHTESNYRSARELLLSRVPVPGKGVHPIPSDSKSPSKDAQRYEDELRALYGGQREGFPVMDFALMGVGPDGHTASLFPGGPELREDRKWVVASRSPIGIKDRITLTAPVFNAAREVVYLVDGEEKAGVLKDILEGPYQPERLPTQLIRPSPGRLLYLLDEPAASKLTRRKR